MTDAPSLAAVDPERAPARVALYGGSFNPPHVGHVAVVAWLLSTTDIDAVWLLPCSEHAFGKALAPLRDRVAMCQAAMVPFDPTRVAVSTLESHLPQPARTVDTLTALRARFPETRFDLAIGADILAERHLWKRWDLIEASTRLWILGRDGYDVPAGYVSGPTMVTAASRDVRAALAAGTPEAIAGIVPRAVLAHIAAAGLYR
ncbi:MAG: nicotinate-nicotinamide nucleotide adenylyltransferase [Myxococcales bacterium]|nr:nicotinate-nicotinamide nucleotide adenylyltransferase [Myxococcales bacterium]